MTTITQNITDIAGAGDNTSWTFYTEQIRQYGTDVVTTKKVRKYPVAGVLTVVLDPGPAVVIAPDGKHYPFTVPNTNSDLWSLIAGAIGMPPGTTQQAIAAAVADYLNAHQIDEYHEYANLAAFPGTGVADRIYVALDTGKLYRWSGSVYVEVSPSAVLSVAGQTGAVTAAQLHAGLSPKQYFVDDFGADPIGATFSDTAVAAAKTAMGTSPGVLVFGAGTYKLNSATSALLATQGVRGQGHAPTVINYLGSGPCFSSHDPSTTAVTYGSRFEGFTINGASNTNANCVGLEVGDQYKPIIADVYIYNFTGANSIGFHGLNKWTWCERANYQMVVGNCTTAYQFEMGSGSPVGVASSGDYSDYNLSFAINANQNGIVLKNIALQGVRMLVHGNCTAGSGSNSGVVLTVGTSSGDVSDITGQIQLAVESAGPSGYIGHTDINVGAAAVINAYGALEFNPFTSATFVAGTATRWNTSFFGRLNCPSLGYMATGSGGQTIHIGGVIANQVMSEFSSGSTITLYMHTGNNYGCQLPNGASTVVFTSPANLNGRAISYDLVLTQPASGAAGTVTWPGNVHWVNGPPVLATTNGASDYFRFVTTDPASGWWGIHLTAVTPAGTATITDKSISGLSNTLTDITQVAEYVGTTSVSGIAVPAGVKTARVTVIPPGSGGGSGRRGAAGTVRCGGGSAGSSGATYDFAIPASMLGGTYAVTIPAVGAGGAAVIADNTNGGNGSRPGDTSFASGLAIVKCASGDVGYGGTNASGNGGTYAGGGTSGVGPNGSSASSSGGAGAPGTDPAYVGSSATGGAGGGITSGDVAGAGGAGGNISPFQRFGGSGGVVGGASPTPGDAATAGQAGVGAGGGAASITGAAQAGANGTGYGAGGSGGGASLNGNNSGAGGAGGPGYVRVVWEF